MNAKEARKILDIGKKSPWPEIYAQEFEARGYLEALQGEEVKALVQVLSKLLLAVKSEPIMNNMKYDSLGIEVNKVISQFREAGK